MMRAWGKQAAANYFRQRTAARRRAGSVRDGFCLTVANASGSASTLSCFRLIKSCLRQTDRPPPRPVERLVLPVASALTIGHALLGVANEPPGKAVENGGQCQTRGDEEGEEEVA